MLYVWLKALHVGAVFVMLGGVLILALVTAFVSTSAPDAGAASERAALRDAILRWDRRVTSPALGLVWVLGIALGLMGGWFGSAWLIVKLCFVVFLSALHGMLHGILRRSKRGNQGDRGLPPRVLRVFPAAIVVSAIAIAVLVIVKPF
jgi:uncharacterized membrane protein